MMMVTEEHNNDNDVDINDNSPDDTSIPEEDIGATVVMTGLPVSLDMGDEKVRASLDSFFSECGSIKRVIFQEDGGQQHAVIVFSDVKSIGPAVALSNTVFLGASVNIVSAAGLGPDAGVDVKDSGDNNNGTVLPASNNNDGRRSITTLVKSSVAGALASGFVFSTNVDNKYNISSTVSKGVKDIDKAYKVTEAVNDLSSIARSHATSIDNQYGISKKTKEITSNLHEQAKTGFNSAMQHETVRKTWGFASNLLSSVHKAVTETVQETREMTKEKINEKLPTTEAVEVSRDNSLLTTEMDTVNGQDDGALDLDPDEDTDEKSVPL
jgi:hypothetical protein